MTGDRYARASRSPGLAVLAALLLGAVGLTSCGDDEPPIEIDRETSWRDIGVTETEPEFDERIDGISSLEIAPPPPVGSEYEVPEICQSVVAFDPAEWETGTPSPSIADPRAKKGGRLRLVMRDWAPTIRTEGPNSRLKTLRDIHVFIYETLVAWDYEQKAWVPSLAKHWQIDGDKKTFRFRIDERARWANGDPVTADDVLATVEHMRNPDRKDPAVAQHWSELIDMGRTKILDRYTIQIAANEAEWRSFLTIGYGMQVYPARYIRMDGETYIRDWNWKLPPGTGPYELRPDGVKKLVAVSIHRRKDWWQADDPSTAGQYNFDEIKWIVVRDQELEFQKFLADEIDVYEVNRSSRWAAELHRERRIRNGWIQMRKIYKFDPQGYGGYCFNLREKPFDSRSVRLAFAHLFNRETLFAKLFYNQYDMIAGYFPGQVYERDDAQPVPYDPKRARELLAADGWVKRDDEGYLVDAAGRRFPEITLEFAEPGFQRIHDVIRNDLWDQAGIKLELKLVDYTNLNKKVWEYKFGMTFFSWTAGLWPDPEFQFHSKYADRVQTNNLNGFKNARADEIFEAYKYEFDQKKREKLLKELDTILFDSHIYALAWYGPYFRLLWWDRFGHPPMYADRYTPDIRNVMALWWFDEDAESGMREARGRGESCHPDAPAYLAQDGEGKIEGQYDNPEFTYWRDVKAKEDAARRESR